MIQNGDRTFIVELPKVEILTIAQMMHMRIAQPHNEYAVAALENLRIQAEGVVMDPKGNWVYPEALMAPDGATSFKGLHYIPLKKES